MCVCEYAYYGVEDCDKRDKYNLKWRMYQKFQFYSSAVQHNTCRMITSRKPFNITCDWICTIFRWLHYSLTTNAFEKVKITNVIQNYSFFSVQVEEKLKMGAETSSYKDIYLFWFIATAEVAVPVASITFFCYVYMFDEEKMEKFVFSSSSSSVKTEVSNH